MKQLLLFILAALIQVSVAQLTPVTSLGLQNMNVEIPQKYTSQFPAGKTVNLAPGFKPRVFYADVNMVPRFIHFSPQGILHVSNMKPGGNGQILALPDADQDGVADTALIVADGFTNNHDFAFYKGNLYVTEPTRIWKCSDNNNDGIYESKTIFIDQVGNNASNGHFTRTIIFDSINEKLYVSVGSSCNVCRENDRAIIEQYNDDGTGKRVFASGVRNAVGMSLHPFTNQLWANNNGSDKQGNETPPEWIDILRDGGFYGHPFAYADQQWFNFNNDPDYIALKPITANDSQMVSTMTEPAALIRAHTAPMALEFLNNSFYPGYRSGFMMALHGSWNTTSPNDFRGYNVIYSDLSHAQDTTVNSVADFCTGFLTDSVNRVYWARPVGLAADGDGSLYMSSDDVTTFIMQFYPDGSNGLNGRTKPINSVSVYPNPSTFGFSISFEIKESTTVSAELYDLSGRKITSLFEAGPLSPGSYMQQVEWGNIPSGYYLVRIITDRGSVTRKVQKI